MTGWIAFALLWAWGGCCAYSAMLPERRSVRLLGGLTWPLVFFFLPGFTAQKAALEQRLKAALRAPPRTPTVPRNVRIHVNVQQYMKQMAAAECLMAKVQRHAVDIGCTIIPPDEIVCHTAEQAAQLQEFWETHSCGTKL